MASKRIPILIAFLLVALGQLYIPFQMIWTKERVLEKGQLFRFKTAPVDPYDPFRGRYIHLDIEEDRFEIADSQAWERGDAAYIILRQDSQGFALINNVLKEQPDEGQDFLKAKVRHYFRKDIPRMTIEYPFERYYMDEYKALPAEQLYRDMARDTTHDTYALVSIWQGDAVLKDVVIDDRSILDWLAERNNEKGSPKAP